MAGDLAELKRATAALEQDTAARREKMVCDQRWLENERAASGALRSEKTITMLTRNLADENELIARCQAEIAAARDDIAAWEKEAS